jgi:hypothetical protein
MLDGRGRVSEIRTKKRGLSHEMIRRRLHRELKIPLESPRWDGCLAATLASADEALLDCKRRFKNLPDRHVNPVETPVRQHFRQTPDLRPGIPQYLK